MCRNSSIKNISSKYDNLTFTENIMTHKKLDIHYARDLTGWAYHEMKWLSDEDASKADRKRNDLLQSIHDRVNSHFLGNKIVVGNLSPGCMSCGRGEWSCLFIGSLCTASCFFCPQDRKSKMDQYPTDLGLKFENPEDYADYLKKFKFKGVSFSGGEPLLKFEKILTYIRKIRERLGNEIYIWLYTNGDLVDSDKLNALKKSGLNEIRFNIAARKYDLKAVKLAAGIIDKVTVEIPAIPEDYKILKRCLPRMKAIGVSHLNLHQLFANQYCYRKFADRKYTFLHQPEIPVLESEMTALKLIQYALDHNIGLSINYCCTIYKHRFQKKAYRDKFQPFIKESYEGLTESRFIRRLSVRDTAANLKKFVKLFQENGCRETLWFFNKDNYEFCFHASLLKYIDFNKHDLTVTYFSPQLTEACDDEDIESKKIAISANRSVYIVKECVHQATMKNSATIKCFEELFVKKKNNADVIKRFLRNYELKTKADIDNMMKEKDLIDFFRNMEFIGKGLYKIY